MKNVIVLLSGGMDSVTCLYEMNRLEAIQVAGVVSFNYGSKHNEREIPFAAYHAQLLRLPHWVIPLGFIGQHFTSSLLKGGAAVPLGHYEEQSMKQTVVPFRNGIMLSIAVGLAESVLANGVVIAAHAGDHAIYPDCREEFMRAMRNAIRLGTYANIELIRPFISLVKADIVKCGNRIGIDYAKTWSCYLGGDIHCGECGTCVERREAFELAGVKDPTVYRRTSPLPAKPAIAAV
jgi:7-cyano-7-deazaguanine synthase